MTDLFSINLVGQPLHLSTLSCSLSKNPPCYQVDMRHDTHLHFYCTDIRFFASTNVGLATTTRVAITSATNIANAGI
jgi:hypothetical protein